MVTAIAAAFDVAKILGGPNASVAAAFIAGFSPLLIARGDLASSENNCLLVTHLLVLE